MAHSLCESLGAGELLRAQYDFSKCGRDSKHQPTQLLTATSERAYEALLLLKHLLFLPGESSIEIPPA
jgi:hypothetical protein